MTLVELARKLFAVAESSGVPYMAVGALAAGTYGIPRSTKDLDLLVSASDPGAGQLMEALDSFIEFDGQSQFDTITWGRRWRRLSRLRLSRLSSKPQTSRCSGVIARARNTFSR